MKHNPFIVMAGNIGCGKSSLTRKLSQAFQLQAFYESVIDNPYLEDFYKDMNRWSFPLQVYFLSSRFNAHRDILQLKGGAIQDRCIYEDAYIFARALFEMENMQERDYQNYLELFQNLTMNLPEPHLVVYLRRSVDGLMERIKQRSRDCESSISRDYIQKLNHCYEDWIQDYTIGNALVVETDGRDFLEREEDFEWLSEKVRHALAIKGVSLEEREEDSAVQEYEIQAVKH